MFQKRPKSHDKARCFSGVLDRILFGESTKSIDADDIVGPYLPVVFEAEEPSTNFSSTARSILKRSYKLLARCLEQPVIRRSISSDQLLELAEHLRSLELSSWVVLSSTAYGCSNYLRERLKEHRKGNIFHALLTNIKIIVETIVRQADTYALYLKHCQNTPRSRKSFSYPMLPEELELEPAT